MPSAVHRPRSAMRDVRAHGRRCHPPLRPPSSNGDPSMSHRTFCIRRPDGQFFGGFVDGQATWVFAPKDGALIFATSSHASATAGSLKGFDKATWIVADVVGLGLQIGPLNHALKATARRRTTPSTPPTE